MLLIESMLTFAGYMNMHAHPYHTYNAEKRKLQETGDFCKSFSGTVSKKRVEEVVQMLFRQPKVPI
jgi:hypothetical protein